MTEMKISELSIGDWVQIGECGHHKGSIAKVWWLSRDSNHIGLFDTCVFSECEDDVLPIPLTPEILEKNGFVKSSEYRWSNPSISCACLRFGTKYWDIRINGRNRAYRPTRISIDNILHTHQLQHALRLAGVEKEIEV